MTKTLITKRTRQMLSVALSTAALLGVTLCVSSPAQAQRQRTDDERQQQRQDRQDRAQNMTPEQRMQALQQRMANMTPEQRQQMMTRAQQWLGNMTPEQQQQLMQTLPPEMQQQMKNLIAQPGQGAQAGGVTSAADLAKWNWIRRALTTAGYTDTTLQDAVVAFMQAQEKAHVPLQDKARTLATVLVKPDTSEAQLTTDLAAFRKAVLADKTRYTTELAALDKKISFSKQPRLESLLSVIGAVGYEVPEIGGLSAVYPNTSTATARTGGNTTGRGDGTARGNGTGRGNGAGRAGRGGAAAGAAVGNAAPAGNAAAAGNVPAAPAPAAPVVPVQ